MRFTRTSIPVAAALLAVVLVGCAPTPPAPVSAHGCPALAAGAWTGSWTSQVYPGAGGAVSADLELSGSSVSGRVSLTGTVLGGGAVSGTIDCRTVELGTVGGEIEFRGSITGNGTRVTGDYATAFAADSGTFTLRLGS